MEDQTAKLEALKKVYAEMILNTAKEAAARAMASERKAVRVGYDLRNTKDEAVRMLVRFKEMIDVKTTEADTRASSQQKRIKELDEQLNETEGVIMDLRAEIRKAHERLEEMKNNHTLHSNGPSENEHMHQKNTDGTERFKCSSPCSKSCNPAKETTTSDPNLASIIIGNKEPELYRNGYTHRIRAIEMNLVDEKKISDETNLENVHHRLLTPRTKMQRTLMGQKLLLLTAGFPKVKLLKLYFQTELNTHDQTAYFLGFVMRS
ncbi:hypothetical protein HanHA300_Chr07g0253931 [Helianthus annuus]|nr:hypothetical protein HanHA300_Chr07g0253931 [Helianthus annuus]